MFSKVSRITLRFRPPSKLIDYNTLAASLFSPFVNLSFSLSLTHSFSFPLSDTLPTRAISSVFLPLYPFYPSLSHTLTGSFTYHGFHAGSHPESGYDSVVLSRFSLRRPFHFLLSCSSILDRSLRWCSASLLTPSPFLPRTLFPSCRTVIYIYREEVSHTTDSRQFSHLESQNFSLPCLPSSLFLSVSTSFSPFVPGLPLSSLASFSVSHTSDIYVYSRAFRFNSYHRTHISPSPFPFFLSLALPSFCSL